MLPTPPHPTPPQLSKPCPHPRQPRKRTCSLPTPPDGGQEDLGALSCIKTNSRICRQNRKSLASGDGVEMVGPLLGRLGSGF